MSSQTPHERAVGLARRRRASWRWYPCCERAPQAANAPCACEIRDPGNLGTILRTLAWFGRFRCLLGRKCRSGNPKVLRASVGAIFHTPIEVDIDLNALRDRFPRIACLNMRTPLPSPQFHQFDCYLFGNEAHGVRANNWIHPYHDNQHRGQRARSLNVATSVGICVYELSRACAHPRVTQEREQCSWRGRKSRWLTQPAVRAPVRHRTAHTVSRTRCANPTTARRWHDRVDEHQSVAIGLPASPRAPLRPARSMSHAAGRLVLPALTANRKIGCSRRKAAPTHRRPVVS